MINFDTAIKLGEEVLASLEKLYHVVYPPTLNVEAQNIATQSPELMPEMPSVLQFRRRLFALHSKRHLVTELIATGKLTQAEAQAMVDAGSSKTSTAVEAAGTAFAEVLAWLQANGPKIEADIAAAIPLIISLITLFGG